MAVEIDGHDEHEAWSIVVRERAERVERPSEMNAAEPLGLSPGIPALTYSSVRIRPTDLTGRRFTLDPEPSRV